MDTQKGKFYVLGGCEGAGKTAMLDFVRREYVDLVITREPGGSEYGEEVREIILKSRHARQADALTHLCLFFASRRDHMRNTVMPALAAGKTVLSDRGDCCSFAYQLYGLEGKHLKDLFLNLRHHTLKEFVPDLYIILDVDPEEGMRRVKLRQEAKGDFNHFDDRGIEFHRRIREGYLEFAKLFPDRVKIVDANPKKEIVWQSINDILYPLFNAESPLQ